MNLERPDFKRVMRGYDTKEVEEAWAEIVRFVADQNAANKELKLQINSLREQNTELGNRLKNYEKMENDLRDALVSAQKISKQIKEEADRKAEELLNAARLDVETILNAAQENAQNKEEETNLQLVDNQLKISEMKSEIDKLTAKKEQMKQRVEKASEILRNLQDTIQEFLNEE